MPSTLAEAAPPSAPPASGWDTQLFVLRAGDRKLVKRYEGPTFELYDLAADPHEEHDLAGQEPETVKELDGRLSAMLGGMGARMPERKAGGGE